MNSPAPQMTVVIPAWNERDNLELMLPALRETLDRLRVEAEIIIADAGSKDGTEEVAQRHGARLVVQRERGYGGALLAGFAAARAPFLVTMDADLSHPPEFLAEFWRRREEAEMMIASRYVPGGQAEMSRSRRLLSVILNRTYSLLLSVPVRDMSSGFRMYRREVIASLTLHSRDFDVLEEILVLVHNAGWRVIEVPFHYMPRVCGQTHAHLVKFGWAYLKTLHRMLLLRLRRTAR